MARPNTECNRSRDLLGYRAGLGFRNWSWLEPSFGKVLDIGCGRAHVSKGFRERYPAATYVGVELLPWVVFQRGDHDMEFRDTPYEVPGRVCIADGMTLPFPDGTFDAVLSLEALQYVQDPARVVEEAYRVLRPGGRGLLHAYHVGELQLRDGMRAIRMDTMSPIIVLEK